MGPSLAVRSSQMSGTGRAQEPVLGGGELGQRNYAELEIAEKTLWVFIEFQVLQFDACSFFQVGVAILR